MVMTRCCFFNSFTQPSHVCKLDEVPCINMMGAGSSIQPSSRTCTNKPFTSINWDGRGAHCSLNSSAVLSGAQVSTKPMSAMAIKHKKITKRTIISFFFRLRGVAAVDMNFTSSNRSHDYRMHGNRRRNICAKVSQQGLKSPQDLSNHCVLSCRVCQCYSYIKKQMNNAFSG